MSGNNLTISFPPGESLALSDRLTLKPEELGRIPESVVQGVQDGYAAVLKDPRMGEFLGSGAQISICPKGDLVLVSKRGLAGYLPGGSRSLELAAFPKLQAALAKAHDAAFRSLPHTRGGIPPQGVEPGWVDCVLDRNWWAAKLGVMIDVNSQARNGSDALGIFARFLPFSRVLGGVPAVFAGLNGTYNSVKGGLQAYKAGDREGMFDHTTNGLCMFSYAGVGVGMAASSVGDSLTLFSSSAPTFSLSSAAMAGLTMLTNIGSLLMYAFILVNSAYWLFAKQGICAFRNQLMTILDWKNVDAWKKAEASLQFLHAQLGSGEKDYDALVRRVGADCTRRIATEAKDLIRGIKNRNPAQLKKAIELVEMANCESFKQKAKQVTLFVIAILGIAATVAGMVFGVPLFVSPLLFAVGAGLWLFVDSPLVQKTLGDWLYRRPSLSGDRAHRWAVTTKPGILNQVGKVFQGIYRWKSAALQKNITETSFL